MLFWSRSHSLQRKIITAIVMVGFLPLGLSLVLTLTYLEERRALRETISANFKEVAVEGPGGSRCRSHAASTKRNNSPPCRFSAPP